MHISGQHEMCEIKRNAMH